MLKRYILATLCAALPAGFSAGQEWGDLEASFFLKGDAKPQTIVPDKDQAICGRLKLVRENIVFDATTKGIANIAVYLLPAPGKKVPVHPDYEKTAKDKVELDNMGCRFLPHIQTIRTTQTLLMKNSDPVGHNMKADFFNNTPFNDLIPAMGQIEKTLTSPETAFTPVNCSIHGWMGAYLLVKEDPYVGISSNKKDETTGEVKQPGHLVIKNIPVGEWTFVVWQENAGYVGDVTLNGTPTKWMRGRVKMTIKPGVNGLGVTTGKAPKIEITPAALKLQ